MVADLTSRSARLRQLGRAELRARLLRGARALAIDLEGEAKANASRRPQVRGGTLRRTIQGLVRPEGDTLLVQVEAGRGGAERYASAQEHGYDAGTERLPVPLPPHAATASRVARYPGPRSTGQRFFVYVARSGRRFLARSGPDGRLQLWYLLISRIPATRYLGRAVETIRPQAQQTLSTVLREGLDA